MMNRFLFLLFLPALLIYGCETGEDIPDPVTEEQVHDRLIAVVYPTERNEASGIVTFTREGEDVRVTAEITGLTPDHLHGFHIHEFGDCSASDGTSAGGHHNPNNTPHGAPTDMDRHMGDMGNLATDEAGTGSLDYVDTSLELRHFHSILGRAVVVHADQDDLSTQPTGDAGARIGCGVIGIGQPLN